MARKALPAERSDGIAGINGQNGEKQVGDVGLADGVNEFPPGEIREVHLVARAIDDRGERGKNDNSDNNLAKMYSHLSARLTGGRMRVKK